MGHQKSINEYCNSEYYTDCIWKSQIENSLHFPAPLQCLHRTSPCPLDPPHHRNLVWQDIHVPHPYDVWWRKLAYKYTLTRVFIEPLQASFTGKCLLAYLWRVMFSENAVEDTKRLRHVFRSDTQTTALTPFQKTNVSVLQNWDQCPLPGMVSTSLMFQDRCTPVLATFLGWQVIPSRRSPLFPRRHGSWTTSYDK